MTDPEEYVDAGTALQQLGRWLQRCHPKPSRIGSQYDEDRILAEMLPEKGTYADIGASHAKECSNTWMLYTRGWRGLLIEPLPDCWADLLLNRIGDIVCPVAASDINGFAKLRVCRTLSSLREDWPNDSTESILVKTMTMRDILAMYPSVSWEHTDLCSIDVEGHELEVLNGFDWASFSPKVIVIEFRETGKEQGADSSGKWVHHMHNNNYRLHRQTPLNQIWVRK